MYFAVNHLTNKHNAELKRKTPPTYKCFAIMINFRFTYKATFGMKLTLEKCLYWFIVSVLDY